MIKRILIINGLAILAVVCCHATIWGYTAMFWWADRYRPVTTPNFDQVGTLPYYILAVQRKLPVFSVPAFLFVSGFFIAYAGRGKQPTTYWHIVRVRLKSLLVPYVIWSTVIFIGDAFQGVTYTPIEYLEYLVLGKAVGAYYYVPLLCQLYLLSPLLAHNARNRGGVLLYVSALVQLSVISIAYLRLGEELLGLEIPGLNFITPIPVWLFINLAFFFVFGIVVGFHFQEFKRWLDWLKPGLIAIVVILGASSVLEAELVYASTGMDWRGTPLTLPSSLYSIAVILLFLTFDWTPIPISRALDQIGSKSYGIYLLHSTALEFAARTTQKFTPWILASPVIFQLVLIVSAVVGPILIMIATAKSPLRRSYRYMFG